MSKLTFQQEHSSKMYEITVIIRDRSGSPTGQKKTFSHDNPYKISEFWHKNNTQRFLRSKSKNSLKKRKESDSNKNPSVKLRTI